MTRDVRIVRCSNQTPARAGDGNRAAIESGAVPVCLTAEQVSLCLASDDAEGLMLYLRHRVGASRPPASGLGRALLDLDGQGAQDREARDVLAFLNDVSGKRFRPTEANLAPIVSLLARGRSAEDLRAVASDLAGRWGSDEGTASMVKPSKVFDEDTFADHLLRARRDGARTDFSRFAWSNRKGVAP